MKSALVIIDIQNFYFGPDGLENPEQAADNTKQVLDCFRKHNLPIYHVQHMSEEMAALAPEKREKAVDIYPLLAPMNGEKVYIKHAPSAFYKTGLSDDLLSQGVTHLVICGMMSHMCIDTSVRAAMDYGFTVTLIDDTCTTRDLEWKGTIIPAKTAHETMMSALNGVFAKVISTDEFIHNADEMM